MRIPYNSLAADYAIHRRAHPVLLEKLAAHCRALSPVRALEVGCGTGNYTTALASMTPARFAGLEPATNMLEVARHRSTQVSWYQGMAEAMPFPDGIFDFLYSVDVIHHVQDRPKSFTEAFRALVPGGAILIATDSPETIRGRAVSHFFPEVVEPEIRRYPAPGEIHGLLAAAGFGEISEETIESTYVLSDPAPFERKVFSSLFLISDEAFQRGLKLLRRTLEAGPVTFASKYVLHHARKPR